MLGQNQASNDFLTPEEASEVETALLSSRDKFTARVAIYSLRVLKRIAEEQDGAIATISRDQIIDWVSQDESVQSSTIPGLETNDSFKLFFSKLVVSSLKPLHQISQETQTPLENLSVTQVVQWFEQEAKARIEQENQ
jgi:outer membrane cobalamin receptor